MSGSIRPERDWSFLLRDLPMSMGLALLIVSPYFLEKVKGGGFFTFDIFESFLVPHLQAVGVVGLLIHLAILVSRHGGLKSRWLMILIGASLLIFAFRGFVSTAGITPQTLSIQVHGWLSFLGEDRLDPATIKRVGVFVILGLGVMALRWIVRDTTSVFRACSAF